MFSGDGKSSVRGGLGISYEQKLWQYHVQYNSKRPKLCGTHDILNTPVTNSNFGPLGASGHSRSHCHPRNSEMLTSILMLPRLTFGALHCNVNWRGILLWKLHTAAHTACICTISSPETLLVVLRRISARRADCPEHDNSVASAGQTTNTQQLTSEEAGARVRSTR